MLVLATGALHSPFLLLLPVPLLALCLVLAPRPAYAALAGSSLVLLIGQLAATAHVTALELTGALALPLLLALLARRLRTWLAHMSLLEEATAGLPTHGGQAAERDGLAELQRQVDRVASWSGATALILWEATPRTIRPVVAAGRVPPSPMPAAGDPLTWLAHQGTPLWLDASPMWAALGSQVAAARVWAGEDGVAWLITYEFARDVERPLHEELAAYCGPLRILLEVLAAQRQAAEGHERMDHLLGLLRGIPVEIELGAFGAQLLEAAIGLTSASGGCIGTWSGDSGEVFAVAGQDGGPVAGARFAGAESELVLAVRAGAPLLREAGKWKPGATQVACEGDRWRVRPRTLVTLPLATPSGVVGAMALWHGHAAHLDAHGLELLGAVLPYAALHLDHAREYGRLRERAERDALTGLRNRRAFEAAFLTERLRFERYARPMALLMLDIDHFKSINDEYGHEAGDEVLRTLARVVESAIRDVDIPARFGGEEFVVLLPETALRPAVDVAERVRAAVERTGVSAAGRTLSIRVSIGVAACPENATSPAALLGTADAALYEAKRGGRNQVRAAAPLASPVKR